jgi:hypothetical protein
MYLVNRHYTFGRRKTRFGRAIELIKVVRAGDDTLLARYPTVVINKDVAHDGEDPRLEVGVLGELVAAADGADHGFLKDILRFITVVSKAERETQEAILKIEKLTGKSIGCHNKVD